MTAENIITTMQEIDVDVTGITLLSVEEANEVDKDTRCVGDSWWLRSPGGSDYYAAIVRNDGFVYDDGFFVDIAFGVRPALQISDLESSNLRIGDRFVLADERWIVTSKDKALCDRIIGKKPFREDWKVLGANDYEESDVKIWLEKWALGKGIIQKVNRNKPIIAGGNGTTHWYACGCGYPVNPYVKQCPNCGEVIEWEGEQE